MADVLDGISPALAEWIAAQPVFFVATAPLARDGHVNLSPRGLDTLRVLAPRRVAFLDLTGSGAETLAHLRENGRITLMLCAFWGPPRIVRLHGRGAAVTPGEPAWSALRGAFPGHDGARAVVDVAVTRVSQSCGYGVPHLRFVAQRDTLPRWTAARGEDGLARYRREKNARSIDGLPALDPEEPRDA